jgi:hypothetical protein
MTDLKKIFILILLLFTQTISKGQDVHDPIGVDALGVFGVKIDSLKKSGLDTFFVYYHYCYSDGYIIPDNATKVQAHELECQNSKHSYIFYRLKGSTFLTKMNECYQFYPIKLDASPTFSYFLANFQILMVDDIIREAAYIDEKGVKQGLGSEHSCYSCLYLSETQNKYYWLDRNHLADKIQDPSNYKKHRTNINYQHNSESHIKIFLDLISKELDNTKFIRRTTEE